MCGFLAYNSLEHFAFPKVFLFLHVLEFKQWECHVSFLLANRFLLRYAPVIDVVGCPDSRLRWQTIPCKCLLGYLLRTTSRMLRVTKLHLKKNPLVLHMEFISHSGHPILQAKELMFQFPYLVQLPMIKKEIWSDQKAIQIGLHLPIQKKHV